MRSMFQNVHQSSPTLAIHTTTHRAAHGGDRHMQPCDIQDASWNEKQVGTEELQDQSHQGLGHGGLGHWTRRNES